jgi:hypothetical protein
MIAAVLGGAAGVWSDLADLRKLRKPDIVIACNDVGALYPARLDGWVTLHAEKLHSWMQRRRRLDYRAFTPEGEWPAGSRVEILRERWAGSSGLYGVQIAMDIFQSSRVVMCGIPLDAAQGHFFAPNEAWPDADLFRAGFRAALPVIRDTARSMSGYTRELLGAPSADWLKTGGGPLT